MFEEYNNLICADVEPADQAENCEALASVMQFLDDQSQNLIIRDVKNNMTELPSLSILREHYIGGSKPWLISMYYDGAKCVKQRPIICITN